MDPDACWAELQRAVKDPRLDPERVAELADALRRWLRGNGFLPADAVAAGWTRGTLRVHLAALSRFAWRCVLE